VLTKSVPVTHVKAGEADGLEVGQFEALVSVVGNKDSYGDVVMSGAFDDSLAEWKASGNPIPVIWSHGYGDLTNHIGYLLDAAEKTIDGKTGLWVKGQLDTSTDPEDAQARKAAKLLRGKRVTQFSFSYDVLEGAMEKSEENGDHFALRKMKLYEVGPTLIGANQATELLDAKAIQALAVEVKAGRVLSAKNEDALRSAHDSIGAVLAALDSNDGKAKADEPAKDEEPPVDDQAAKSEEPMRPTPADLSALQSIELDALCVG
jgi:HK97 family phage prohead protease